MIFNDLLFSNSMLSVALKLQTVRRHLLCEQRGKTGGSRPSTQGVYGHDKNGVT